jgi:hypothetical protein
MTHPHLAARAAVVLVALAASVFAQRGAPKEWTTEDDHRHMMGQLGITKLRPGRNPKEGTPNAANYDEALANPFPKLPDPKTSSARSTAASRRTPLA